MPENLVCGLREKGQEGRRGLAESKKGSSSENTGQRLTEWVPHAELGWAGLGSWVFSLQSGKEDLSKETEKTSLCFHKSHTVCFFVKGLLLPNHFLQALETPTPEPPGKTPLSCSWSILIMHAMFYKVTVSTLLTNTEPLLLTGMQG